MKTFYRNSLLTIPLILFSFYSIAQPGDPDGGTDPDSPVPIDGVSLLLAAGGLYGVRKVYRYRNQKNNT